MESIRPFDPTKVPVPAAGPKWPERANDFAHVDLEIGAGAGLHAIRYAQANPKRFLIAIERTTKYLRLEKRQLHHPNLENLCSIRADAIFWVTHFVPAKSLSRIFLLYPNPYPKHRQQNLRWHAMPFMGLLLSRLKDDGELTLATNEKFYADEAQDWMTRVWQMDLYARKTLNQAFKPRTHFEKKYLERNEICFDLVFRPRKKVSQLDT